VQASTKMKMLRQCKRKSYDGIHEYSSSISTSTYLTQEIISVAAEPPLGRLERLGGIGEFYRIFRGDGCIHGKGGKRQEILGNKVR